MELLGLASIISTSNGALHGIASPPLREDFVSDEAFADAHHEWWVRTTFWRVEVREL
jgi:hypothetical protein